MTITTLKILVDETMEVLRGKTLIESVAFTHDGVTLVESYFGFSFLDYVIWPYAQKINSIAQTTHNFSVVEISGRQLFSEPDKKFKIGFLPNSLYFAHPENIEETLFLDLKRYLEHKSIPYEVRKSESG